jgi:predicted nucleotidyltransferase
MKGMMMSEIYEPLKLAQLLALLRQHMPDLETRYRVASLGVFGSYVRNEQQPDSDLDLLVEFHDPPSLFAFIRLENELSDLLGVKVDLVMRSALKPGIGRHVLDETIQI